MRLKPPKKAGALIPTGSMADIAFLLIIFFMVTTVHEVDRTNVNLPTAGNVQKAEQGAAIVVMAKIVQDGVESLVYKFSDGKQMSKVVAGPQDIYHEASTITYRDSTTQFVLKADGTVPFEKIDELLDNLREGGVQKVLLLSVESKRS